MGHYKEISRKGVKKILVTIFKYHGDVLLTYPVYSALKSALPEAEIDVYLFKETRPMLEGHPAISHFLEYDQGWRKLSFFKRLFKELMMWKKVRSGGYDLVLNLTSGDRGAIACKVSKAPIRVGITSNKYTDRFFTQLVRTTRTPRHIVERNLDLVRAIGIFPKESEREVLFHIPASAQLKVDEMISHEEFILVHPTSRCDYKHWPESCFTQLIQDLTLQGENVVVSAGPSQEELLFVKRILEPISYLRVHNVAGKLTLKELGALIARSKLLISVDSVPSHMASALQKPLVVIFGPSDDIKWGPWRNQRARVVRLDVPCKRCDQEGCGGSWHSDCLERLPAAKVLDAACQVLRSSSSYLSLS